MVDHREGPGNSGGPVPRDMPDQQAGPADDPWDAADPDRQEQREEPDAPDTDVPDTDEAGTGRRGAPHAATVHPEHPVPDESSA